jgi:hypothetical protein
MPENSSRMLALRDPTMLPLPLDGKAPGRGWSQSVRCYQSRRLSAAPHSARRCVGIRPPRLSECVFVSKRSQSQVLPSMILVGSRASCSGVVGTGAWLVGREVLISPLSVRESDTDGRVLHVSISKDQVKNSPSMDSQKPVSRQHEMGYSAQGVQSEVIGRVTDTLRIRGIAVGSPPVEVRVVPISPPAAPEQTPIKSMVAA